jgi:hypothetical protein
MSVKIGTPKIAYGKTVIFDTPGNHTFIHPSPGKNLQAFVEIFGGGGGSQATSGAATDGGDTIWNTSGSPITVDGGSGADTGNIITTGLNGKGLFDLSGRNYGNNAITVGWTNGSNHYGSVSAGDSISGNVGDVKRFDTTITGNIGITVGTAGTGNGGNGKSGAVIIHYNVLDNEVPVTVSNPPEVDEYIELSWREGANVSVPLLTANTRSSIAINTEISDPGNYAVVNGDNSFTLQAGTYEIEFRAPVFDTLASDDTAIVLKEVGGSDLFSEIIVPPYQSSGQAKLKGRFTVASPTSYTIDIIKGISTDTSIGGRTGSSITDLIDKARLSLTRKAYS